jgi:hypothetical protein
MASLASRIEKAEERIVLIKERLLNNYNLLLEEKVNKNQSYKSFVYKSSFGEVEITLDSRCAYICVRNVIKYENEQFISKNETINEVLKVLNKELQIFDALMYKRLAEKPRRLKTAPLVANMHIKIQYQKSLKDSYYITVASLNNVLMFADIFSGENEFKFPAMLEFYIKDGKLHDSNELRELRENICKGHGLDLNTKNIRYKDLGDITEMVEY